MSTEVVGREQELASLRAFIEREEGGPAALVFEGEPGIGKSTLWVVGVQEAAARGLRVLSARPSEAERGLAHAGLGDLFEGVLGDVLSTLAPPRRHALEVALLVEEAHDDPVDHRALAVAVRDVLDLLSDREPVVVAVDDVQWLDPSSARALAFALRRLGEKNIRVLLARRLVAGAGAFELESGLPTGAASSSSRSASARCTGCSATGSADRLHARHFSGFTNSRAGTRSSRSRSPARSTATSTRSNRCRSLRLSRGLFGCA